MRLGQLARELKVSITDVRSQLQEEFNLEFTKGPNTKLEEAHVAFIRNQFAPTPIEEEQEEVMQELISDEDQFTTVSSNITENKEQSVPNEVDQEIMPEEENNTGSDNSTSDDEVVSEQSISKEDPNSTVSIDELEKQIAAIPEEEYLKTIAKAEKIETEKITLAGIKVIDKIDLPEPIVKKEAENTDEESDAEQPHKTEEKLVRKKSNHRKKRTQNHPKKETQKTPEKKTPKRRTPTNKELREQASAKNYKPKAKQSKPSGRPGGKKKKKKMPHHNAPNPVVKETVLPAQEEKSAFGKLWDWLTKG